MSVQVLHRRGTVQRQMPAEGGEREGRGRGERGERERGHPSRAQKAIRGLDRVQLPTTII